MADKENAAVPGAEEAVTGAEKKATEYSESEMMLLKTAEALQKSMEYMLSQLNSRKIRSEMKLKYARSMPRQVEAMVKVILAMRSINSKSADAVDFAVYLSKLESAMPSNLAPAKIAKIARTMREHSLKWQRSLTMHRPQCVDKVKH